MKKYVLDSFSLLAYAENEPGGGIVADILKKAILNEAETYLSVVNWGEMYYITLREYGKGQAELYRKTFEKYPIETIDADQPLTLAAAEFKARYSISYADAFAIGLAKTQKAELVTGDPEFKPLESEVRIQWLEMM